MGKAYRGELEQLGDTYEWAVALPIDDLAKLVARLRQAPLLVCGSGGSLTAAEVAASLHERMGGKFAKSVTPLDLVLGPRVSDSNLLLVSSGGSNPDILAALAAGIEHEPAALGVVCGAPSSPLARLARKHEIVDLFCFRTPSSKDGFLATNTLLALTILLARAYRDPFEPPFPRCLDAVLHPRLSRAEFEVDLRSRCSPLWDRDTVSVLYGPSLRPAALDLESKFTEAALGNVHIADYRNFAHGRHQWLTERGHRTGVIALVGDDDYQLAKKTINLIPENVPVVQLEAHGPADEAIVAAISLVLFVAGLAGEAQGKDPGRPHVSDFGRRIYRLRGLPQVAHPRPTFESIAVQRKLRCPNGSDTRRAIWLNAMQDFLERLGRTCFRGLALDFDGTLCHANDRAVGVGPDIVGQLTRFLSADVKIAIATGRGVSVKADLRRKLPQELWGNLLVGYYNGAYVGSLTDDAVPDSTDGCGPALKEFENAVRVHPELTDCKCTFRRRQITVELQPTSDHESIWAILQTISHSSVGEGTSVLRSTHSFDIVAPGVSKLKVMSALSDLTDGYGDILAIGDQGLWPGNDFAFLSTPYALSVDEVSAALDTCWNFAPVGCRGVQATLAYLRACEISGNAFRIQPSTIWGRS